MDINYNHFGFDEGKQYSKKLKCPCKTLGLRNVPAIM